MKNFNLELLEFILSLFLGVYTFIFLSLSISRHESVDTLTFEIKINYIYNTIKIMCTSELNLEEVTEKYFPYKTVQ